ISRKKAKEMTLEIEGADPEAAIARSGAVREELEAARDNKIAAQLDELDKLYQKAREHIALVPERLRDVINLGLTFSGAQPLVSQEAPAGSYALPPMEKVAAGDPTWREIVDTLRKPRPRKMPLWEWRANFPPRPVSFEPSTTLASDAVQLHLQHRLTQKA